MKTVYSDDHNLHGGLLDPRGHNFRESSECPARANNVADAVRALPGADVIGPDPFPEEKYLRLHARDYLEFLKTVWKEWEASDEQGPNARPDTFVGAGMRHADTDCVVGKLGRYSFDSTSPFVEGSWQAIRSSANVALTAVEIWAQSSTSIPPPERSAMICTVFDLPPMNRTRTSSNPMPSMTGVMISARRRSI